MHIILRVCFAVSIVALAVLVFFRMSFSSSNSCSALSLLSKCFCSTTDRPIPVVLFSMRLAGGGSH